MKTIVQSLFFTLTLGCAMGQDKNIFFNLADQDSIVISLKQYGLKEVPEDIAQLAKATILVISPDPLKTGWTIYPPPGAFEEYIDKPPFRYLPNAMTGLTNLQELTLRQLDIKKLPQEFDKLENLEKLDLSLNKLIIKDEIDKITKLKKLKQLTIFGNRVTKEDILLLKTANPALSIDLEEYFKH